MEEGLRELEQVIATQELQTNTIKELLDIWTMLNDRVEALEADKEQ